MYPLPFPPSFPKKLPKILVNTQSFSSLFLRFASTVYRVLPSANPVVSAITSWIIQAITVTGLSDE